MCESLRKLHGSTGVFPHLISILQHCLLLQDEHMWAFIDHLIQQVSIQTVNGDPDIAVLQMNVEECCKVSL
jgi:dishevelled associated activator of morphogenesis